MKYTIWREGRLDLKKIIKVVLVCSIIISLTCGVFVRYFCIKESNIETEMSNFSLEDKITKLDYYSDENDFDLDELEQMIKDEVESGKESECIIEAYPTGCTYVNNTVLMQEVEVKEVIKGKCKYKKIWISNNGSTINVDKDGEVILAGFEYGLMKKNNKYLIFCQASEINDWSNKKVYEINDSMWFPYFNLDKNSNKLASNSKYDREIEFYTDSPIILKFYNSLKKEIIDEFYKK